MRSIKLQRKSCKPNIKLKSPTSSSQVEITSGKVRLTKQARLGGPTNENLPFFLQALNVFSLKRPYVSTYNSHWCGECREKHKHKYLSRIYIILRSTWNQIRCQYLTLDPNDMVTPWLTSNSHYSNIHIILCWWCTQRLFWSPTPRVIA